MKGFSMTMRYINRHYLSIFCSRLKTYFFELLAVITVIVPVK